MTDPIRRLRPAGREYRIQWAESSLRLQTEEELIAERSDKLQQWRSANARGWWRQVRELRRWRRICQELGL